MLDGEKSAKRYEPETIDIENPNVCYTLEIRLIGRNKTVLEVGPATGYITRILKSFGNRVYCVEIDSEAAKEAEKYCDKMIVGDIEELDLDSYFEPEMFDVILFGDVLEHLKWPNKVLKNVKKYLKPDGYIVASIPNIAHGDIILSLICGKFEYKPLGLLDETHLRFFTLDTIFKMFRECGYKITEVYTTKCEVGYSEFGDVVKKVPAPIVNFVKKLPYSNVYQFVIKAHHAEYPAEEAKIEKISISSIPIDEIVELQRKILEYEKELRDLKISVELKEERIKELRDRLERLEAELRGKDDRIFELEASLNSKEEEIKSLHQEIENLRSVLNDKDREIEKLVSKLEELEKEITEKENLAKSLEKELIKKSNELEKILEENANLKEEISVRDNRMRELQKELAEREERISILSNSLEEKIKEINKLKIELINLRKGLESKEIELRKKKDLVERLEKNLADVNSKLKEVHEENARLKEEISAKDKQIRKLTEDVMRLSSELESIKSSVTWRTVMKWHSFIERIAPLGTRRRRWYDSLVASFRTRTDKKKLGKKELTASIIIPNYNGGKYLARCISSLLNLDFPKNQYEIIIVDNNSRDSSKKIIRRFSEKFNNIRLIELKENMGFAGACNVGIHHSRGKYVVLLNNDTIVDKNWLKELVKYAEMYPKVAGFTSKIYFMDNPNVIQNAGSYITIDGDGGDIGFRQRDLGQFDNPRNVVAICGASCLLKKDILEEVGLLDEDFFCYYEDTDLSYRLNLAGYELMYVPTSIVYHKHAGTSKEWSPFFTYHVFRNKILMNMKNAEFSRFMLILARYLLQVLKECKLGVNTEIHKKILFDLMKMSPRFIVKRVKVRANKKIGDNELKLKLVKKVFIKGEDIRRIGIYNAFLPTFGGGELQTAAIIKALNKLFPDSELEVIYHPTDAYPKEYIDQNKEKIEKKFLREYNLKKIDLSFRYLDNLTYYQGIPNKKKIECRMKLSKVSKEYDIFVNNTYMSDVINRSKLGIYYCMFPFKIVHPTGIIKKFLHSKFIYKFLSSYNLFLANSGFTQTWIERYWGVQSWVLYPPLLEVNTNPPTKFKKENIILNIGRFFEGGHNKKQDVLIRTFIQLYDSGHLKDWKLVLVGRKHSIKYTKMLEDLAKGYPIEFKYSISREELLSLLKKAKIYWHATGFGEDTSVNPEKFEHFGLSTIEAMNFGVVPVVFNSGGQPEVVTHRVSGFIWNTLDELKSYMIQLIENEHLRCILSENAFKRSLVFTQENFNVVLKEYLRFIGVLV